MSEMYPDPSGQPTYPPPPATVNPYANPPGGTPPQPYGQHPYGQPYGQQPYGQPPMSPGYNAYNAYYPHPPNTRPGQVLTAAVLAYVLAGILILTGVILLFGASSAHTFGDAFNTNTDSVTAELAFDGFVDLVAGGLLIAGGVSLSGRGRRGRTLLTVGAGITLVDCVYWLARSSGDAGALVFVVVYGALALLSLVFALSGLTTRWLAEAPAAPAGYGA